MKKNLLLILCFVSSFFYAADDATKAIILKVDASNEITFKFNNGDAISFTKELCKQSTYLNELLEAPAETVDTYLNCSINELWKIHDLLSFASRRAVPVLKKQATLEDILEHEELIRGMVDKFKKIDVFKTVFVCKDKNSALKDHSAFVSLVRLVDRFAIPVGSLILGDMLADEMQKDLFKRCSASGKLEDFDKLLNSRILLEGETTPENGCYFTMTTDKNYSKDFQEVVRKRLQEKINFEQAMLDFHTF